MQRDLARIEAQAHAVWASAADGGGGGGGGDGDANDSEANSTSCGPEADPYDRDDADEGQEAALQLSLRRKRPLVSKETLSVLDISGWVSIVRCRLFSFILLLRVEPAKRC